MSPHCSDTERVAPSQPLDVEEFENSVLPCTRFFFNDENRVRRRAEFLHSYNNSEPVRRRGVAVFIVNRGETPAQPTRMGITATKKAIGDAHKRNRLRRMVREIFRLALPDLKPGYTIIVNLTRNALQMKHTDLRRSLRGAWHEAQLFKTDLPPVQRSQTVDTPPTPEPVETTQPCPPPQETGNFARALVIIESPFRLLMLGIVKLYRLTLSRIMPPVCRFHPSCSTYGLECLQTLPFHRALPLMIWRILRCNPLCQGGYDPVPNGRHDCACPHNDDETK